MIIKRFLSLCSLLLLLSCTSTREEKTVLPLPDEKLRAAISIDDLAFVQRNIGDYDSKSEALYFALEANSLNTLAYLLDLQEEEEDSPWLDSPYFYVRSREALDLLLRHRYSVNRHNLQEESLTKYYLERAPRDFLLYFLQEAKDLDLSSDKQLPFLLLSTSDVEVIKAALARKANFVVLDERGNYPIYYAKNWDILEILLDLPYNPSQKNKRQELVLGEVYLHCLKSGRQDLAQKCIQLGLNPSYSSYDIKK